MGPAGQWWRKARGSWLGGRFWAGALLGRAKLVIAVRKGEGKLGSGPSGEESDGLGRKEVGHGRSRPTGRNRGKRKKFKFFLFLIFFQSKFKMKFQLNSKSDFKPINTKYYAIA